VEKRYYQNQMNKRGAIDISFNWIFVLIAGAAILTFFIAVIATQKDKAETEMAITIKTELQSIFSGASLSQNRELDIDIPSSNLEFTCDFATCTDFSTSTNPSCYSEFVIGKTGINTQLPAEIIFSPNHISGKKILTWTKPWHIPFFVTNFLFISGADSHYLFIDSGHDSTLTFFNEFPEKMNKDMISLESLETYNPKGSSTIKFIFVNFNPEEIIMPEQILSATNPEKINAINILPETKQINFYYLSENSFTLSDTITFMTESEIYAAMFSDEVDSYKCNMQKAVNRFHISSEVLNARAGQLYAYPSLTNCQIFYADYANGLRTIIENTFVYSNQAINNLAVAVPTLESANLAAQERSCPLIY